MTCSSYRRTAPRRPPSCARVTITSEGTPGPQAEFILAPVDEGDRASVSGSVYGYFLSNRCEPYLGTTHGGSPGYNWVLL